MLPSGNSGLKYGQFPGRLAGAEALKELLLPFHGLLLLSSQPRAHVDPDSPIAQLAFARARPARAFR